MGRHRKIDRRLARELLDEAPGGPWEHSGGEVSPTYSDRTILVVEAIDAAAFRLAMLAPDLAWSLARLYDEIDSVAGSMREIAESATDPDMRVILDDYADRMEGL